MISFEELEKEIEDLVRHHVNALERYLRFRQFHLPDDLVGEVINDALLVIADKRRRDHPIADPKSYLFKVARNAAIDRLKSHYVSEIPDSPSVEGIHAKRDMLAEVEIREDLRQAIRQLPPRQRQVIELRFLGDFSVAETAEILGLAEGTIGPTTTSALRRLGQILTATWKEET